MSVDIVAHLRVIRSIWFNHTLRSWLFIAVAIVLFPVVMFFWRRSLGVPFFALSGDDFHRTLYAWEVTQGRLVPSDLWLPLQFWIEALLLSVYPHILSVPYLTNLTAATATLALLAASGRSLGLSPLAVLIALGMTVTLPWFAWLSISGLSEALFFAALALTYAGVAVWRSRSREWALWAASLGLIAAGMVRYDGWGHAVAFSLCVAWYWRRDSGSRAHRWLIAAGLPWVFPIIWLTWQWQIHGDPFWFSRVVRNYTNCQIEGDEGTILRDLLSAAPITGAAAAYRMIRSPCGSGAGGEDGNRFSPTSSIIASDEAIGIIFH